MNKQIFRISIDFSKSLSFSILLLLRKVSLIEKSHLYEVTMNLNSFDVGDKSEPDKQIQGVPNPASKQVKKKEFSDALSLLFSFPKGAFAINEAFLLFTYDPFDQAIFPKKIEHVKSKHLEHYLLFDTINQQVFAPSSLVSQEAKKHLVEQIQEHVQQDITWMDLPPVEWDAVHTAIQEHVDEFHLPTQTNSKPTPSPTEDSAALDEKIEEMRETRKKAEEKKKKELEELEQKLHTLTLAELAQIFAKLCNRTREIEEEFIQRIEEEKERRFDERKESIEAKELLKAEIKLEVEKMRLVAEARKKHLLNT
jgi:flagellar biosynthesis GTPase FlhF